MRKRWKKLVSQQVAKISDIIISAREIFLEYRKAMFSLLLDSNPVRYSKFYLADRKNQRKVFLLTKTISERNSTLHRLYAEKLEEIKEKYEAVRKEKYEREVTVESNERRPKEERIELPWSGLDETSNEEINSWEQSEIFIHKNFFDTESARRELSNAIDNMLATQRIFWTEEAKLLIVPLPSKNEEEMWMGNSPPILSEKGISVVRSLVRKERSERTEFIRVRIALYLSVLTFSLSIWNAYHLQKARRADQQTLAAQPDQRPVSK